MIWPKIASLTFWAVVAGTKPIARHAPEIVREIVRVQALHKRYVRIIDSGRSPFDWRPMTLKIEVALNRAFDAWLFDAWPYDQVVRDLQRFKD